MNQNTTKSEFCEAYPKGDTFETTITKETAQKGQGL